MVLTQTELWAPWEVSNEFKMTDVFINTESMARLRQGARGGTTHRGSSHAARGCNTGEDNKVERKITSKVSVYRPSDYQQVLLDDYLDFPTRLASNCETKQVSSGLDVTEVAADV